MSSRVNSFLKFRVRWKAFRLCWLLLLVQPSLQDSNSSGPTAVFNSSVSDLLEALATDSSGNVNNHDSTEATEMTTEISTSQSQEDLNQTSPTRLLESDGQGFSESTPGFNTSAGTLPETMTTNSDDGDDRDSYGTEDKNGSIWTIPAGSIKDGLGESTPGFNTSVDTLEEAEIIDLRNEGKDKEFTEKQGNKGEYGENDSQSQIDRVTSTILKASFEDGFSESAPGFSTSAETSAETLMVDSNDEGDDRNSYETQGSNTTTSTIPTESIENGIAQKGAFLLAEIVLFVFGIASLLSYQGIPYAYFFSDVNGRELPSNRMSSGAPESNSSHNDSIRTQTKSEYIETKVVELQTLSSIGTLQEEGLPPATIAATIFGILFILALVIGVSIMFIRRRRRMRGLKFNIALVECDDVNPEIPSAF
ncbi:hypothetical protein AAHC03_022750 [Spirometra sp. Aus1]